MTGIFRCTRCWGPNKKPHNQSTELIPFDDADFFRTGRSTYLRIDLDAIWHNIQVVKKRCATYTEIMPVIKGNGYGHGSVGVAKYLSQRGIRIFGVGTAEEGRELRDYNVEGTIQVFGNSVTEEIDTLLQYNLTPTVASISFLEQWAAKADQLSLKMSKGGKMGYSPHPSETVKACEKHQIPVHSLMTHFAKAWDDSNFTQEQLETFLDATRTYRYKGMKIHAANSAAVFNGYATGLDYVRLGIAMYGLPIDTSPESVSMMQSWGMRPALAWIAKPNLVTVLEAGRKIGYDQTYKLNKETRIATFSFGYADGYKRQLSNKGVLTDMACTAYDIIGIVSMDTITVGVDDHVTLDTPFYVIQNDYVSPNGVVNMARMLQTVQEDIVTSLSVRLPRIFVTERSRCLYRGSTLFTF